MSKNKDGFESGQELTFEQVQSLMRKETQPVPKPTPRNPKGDK